MPVEGQQQQQQQQQQPSMEDIRRRCQERLRSVLRVKVIRGRKLHDTDLFSKIDPYIQVKFGQEVSTSICLREAGRDVDFDWNVSFPFDATAGEPPLELIVMDNNTLRPDDFVGSCSISHDELVQYQRQANALDGEVQLTRTTVLSGKEKPAGFLEVHIYWEHRQLRPGDVLPVPTLHCISNHNLGGSVIRELLDGGKFEIFRTWQMNLWMVDCVFQGNTCGWNQSYKAAQMIYGDGAKAKMIRTVIKAQHSTLYSKDKGVGAYKEYEVQGGLEFYQMLSKSTESSSGGLLQRKTKTSSDDGMAGRRYTYVILPDSTMHFSQTGKATAQDFLSKHALHSCAQESVVYAGEFFFDTKIHAKPTLIIDNNSGTFAPPKEKLPCLQALLELNFGYELPVVALDRDDADLQMYFDANGIQ